MHFRLSQKGCSILCLWLAFIGVLVILIAFSIKAVLYMIFWALLCFAVGLPYFSSYKIYLDKTHLMVSHGIFFIWQTKIQRKNISSCLFFQTPLHRLSRTGVVFLSYAGGVCFLPAMSLNDARTLANEIGFGGIA